MARKNAKKSALLTTKQVGEKITVEKEEKETPSSGIYGWVLKLLAVLAGLVLSYYLRERDQPDHYISRNDVTERLRFNVTCVSRMYYDRLVPGCHQENDSYCGRALFDKFVTPLQVTQLREIAEIGMQNRSKLGGPTIMDINTGFVRDSEGLVNIYQPENRIPDENKPGVKRFSSSQFSLYRRVVEKIRKAIMKEFGLKELFFSAPTFITRLIGNASWTPSVIHDEYWHPHVDKENTRHYDYSGLLYLADYQEEFTGGLFSFIDNETTTIIEPARGRLVMFTAGSENLHVVRKVETGTRYVLSLWFSCDERKQFMNFLDGQMHKHFRRS